MTRSGFNLLAAFLVAASAGFAATTNEIKLDNARSENVAKLPVPEHLPKFDELYQLLRTNLGGVTETDLDRAVVKGLLNQLQSQVTLVGGTSNSPAASAGVSKAIIYDNSFAYFRFGKISGDLGEKFISSYRELAATSKSRIKGIILDLRFAGGSDYTAAAAVADQFLNSEQALLDWGTGSARSTAKTNALAVPVAVLINSETSGSAEALAATLRETNVGLLIGNTSAGLASVFKEFSLTNGQKLRIATAQIKLGNGTVLAHGLKPDIEVPVSLPDEKVYLEDPYKILRKTELTKASETETNVAGSSATNRNHRRFNEAELVRQQREGTDLEPTETDGKPRKEDPDKPVLADPALVRALDLLKGLAVVQQSRPG